MAGRSGGYVYRCGDCGHVYASPEEILGGCPNGHTGVATDDPNYGVSRPEEVTVYPTIPGWEVEKELGAGGQAITYLAHRRGDPDSRAVIKVLKPWSPGSKSKTEFDQRHRFKQEVVTQAHLYDAKCPRVVPVLESGLDTDASGQPWYAMPFYSVGSMCVRDSTGEVVRWAEGGENGYRGKLDRVLEIGIALAETLEWMHGHEPQTVHRDVHTSNVFFEIEGGEPILGDFGIVHVHDGGKADVTGGMEALGPWRCRPPELQPGSENARLPATDVYQLGSLMYEALSGGISIPLPERIDGTFTHESPDYTLTQFSDDPRVPLLSTLLRRALASNHLHRITAGEMLQTLRAIRSWTAETSLPPLVSAETAFLQEAEKARQTSPVFHAKHIPTLLFKVGEGAIDRLLGRYKTFMRVTGGDVNRARMNIEVRDWEFCGVVNFNTLQARDPIKHLLETYPGFYWVRALMKVFFEPDPKVEQASWVLLGRSADNQEVILTIDGSLGLTEVSRTFAGDPLHLEMYFKTLVSEAERISAAALEVVRLHRESRRG